MTLTAQEGRSNVEGPGGAFFRSQRPNRGLPDEFGPLGRAILLPRPLAEVVYVLPQQPGQNLVLARQLVLELRDSSFRCFSGPERVCSKAPARFSRISSAWRRTPMAPRNANYKAVRRERTQ